MTDYASRYAIFCQRDSIQYRYKDRKGGLGRLFNSVSHVAEVIHWYRRRQSMQSRILDLDEVASAIVNVATGDYHRFKVDDGEKKQGGANLSTTAHIDACAHRAVVKKFAKL